MTAEEPWTLDLDAIDAPDIDDDLADAMPRSRDYRLTVRYHGQPVFMIRTGQPEPHEFKVEVRLLSGEESPLVALVGAANRHVPRYSCPKSSEGCCNEAAGDECNCGADEHNAIVDRVAAALVEAERRIDAAAKLHRRSLFPASRGAHQGRHYCLTCTSDVDDFTAYVDWPCATAAALGLPVREDTRLAPLGSDERPYDRGREES